MYFKKLFKLPFKLNFKIFKNTHIAVKATKISQKNRFKQESSRMLSSSSSTATIKQRIILNTVKKCKQNQVKNKQIFLNNANSKYRTTKYNFIKKQAVKSKDQFSMQQELPQTTLRFQRVTDNCQQYPKHLISDSTPKWSIGDFEILQQLGHGKFGQVYAARQLQTDFIVALKKMSRAELAQNNFQNQIRREVIIQSSLKHDNILKMFGYFWDQEAIYLILQYAPKGEIYGLLKKHKSFSQKNVSIIIRQVLQALAYLHKNSIIHRDIKPQNLLLSLENIKLADFGWSIHSDKRRDTLCGTLDYLAPQMVKGSTHDSSIDIWQVGILTYELSIGYPPFQTNSYDETYEKIVNSDVIFPEFTSFQLRKFIRKCLQKRPQKRLKVEECLKQQFIQAYLDQQLDLDN